MEDFKAKALDAFREKLQKKSGEEIQEGDIYENGIFIHEGCKCYTTKNALKVHSGIPVEHGYAPPLSTTPIPEGRYYYINHPGSSGDADRNLYLRGTDIIEKI